MFRYNMERSPIPANDETNEQIAIFVKEMDIYDFHIFERFTKNILRSVVYFMFFESKSISFSKI